MGFKKMVDSDVPIILSDTGDESGLFRPGFCYQIEDHIYTVVEDVSRDSTASLRKVQLGDGTIEIMTVDSIKRDIRSYGVNILPVVEKYLEKLEDEPDPNIESKEEDKAEKKDEK